MRTKNILQIALLCFIFHFSFFTPCKGQSWLSAAQGKGGGEETGLATNENGDCFITGYFSDTLHFGPFRLSTIYNSHYYAEDYLAKFDKIGNAKWAVQSSPLTIYGTAGYASVAADRFGNSFFGGFFEDSVRFGTITVYTHAFQSAFIAKLDSNGNFVWVRYSDGIASGAEVFNVAVDEEGNSYLTGYFGDTTTYFGAIPLITSRFNNCVFLVKYDPNGNVMWAKQSNSYTSSQGNGIAVDKLFNVYLTGFFEDSIFFGPDLLISAKNDHSAFLVKYDSNGNIKWAEQSKKLRSTNISGNSVASCKNDDAIITGVFGDSAVFGKDTLVSSATEDIFISKYDSSGNEIWAKCASVLDSGLWTGYSLATDSVGYIYLSAGNSAPAPRDANITFGSLNINLRKIIDPALIVQFNDSGRFICGSIVPSGGDDWNSAACSNSGKFVYFGGDFGDTLVFGPDTISYLLKECPYIARWQPCQMSEEGIKSIKTDNESIIVYPNPSTGKFTMQLSVVSCQWSVEVYNVFGVCVCSQSNIQNSTSNIDLSSQPSGIYLYRVVSEDGKLVGNGKLVIDR